MRVWDLTELYSMGPYLNNNSNNSNNNNNSTNISVTVAVISMTYHKEAKAVNKIYNAVCN